MEEAKAKIEMVEVVAMLDLKPEENSHFFEILGDKLVYGIDTHAFVKKHYLDPDMPCYVVKVNGKLIPAYMFYMPISPYGFYGLTPDRDSGECTSIWIHDNHRRKGYGTKLVNHRSVEYVLPGTGSEAFWTNMRFKPYPQDNEKLKNVWVKTL